MRPALVIIVAYLLGSIPFGYLIVRARAGDDIRETGSGGTGATNVSRRVGKGAGILTLILDALKGALAVIAAAAIVGASLSNPEANQTTAYWFVAAAGVAVILGHMFPVWLGFRGGKGVATGVGVFLMLAPLVVALVAGVFVLIVAVTRFVSLGSIISAAAMPIFALAQNSFIKPLVPLTPIVTAAVLSSALIVFAHRANIRRLLQGTESKFR